MFSWMIPKPDLIFVLEASPECIFGRKQELTIDEIRKQLEAYKLIVKRNSNAYAINVERDVESIVDEITMLILQVSEDRTKKIMK